MGSVGGNGENGRIETHRIYETNNGKLGASEGGKDVRYTKGGGSEGSGVNPVENNLHQTKTRDGGTVGGAVSNIRGMHKVDGILGSREQEGCMVYTGGSRDTSQVNPGGNSEGDTRRYGGMTRTHGRDRRERQRGQSNEDSEILGRRRATPRWEEYPMLRMEMLLWRW